MTGNGTAPADRPATPHWPVRPDDHGSDHEQDINRLAASFDLMASVLDGTSLADLLALVVTRALPLAGARLAFIALPGEVPNTLAVEFAAGLNAEEIRGVSVRTGTSVIGRVFTTRRALASHVATNPALRGLPAGPILLLPLDTGERARGVLALAGGPGDLQFTPAVRRQLLIFASTSAIMIEMAEERRATRPG